MPVTRGVARTFFGRCRIGENLRGPCYYLKNSPANLFVNCMWSFWLIFSLFLLFLLNFSHCFQIGLFWDMMAPPCLHLSVTEVITKFDSRNFCLESDLLIFCKKFHHYNLNTYIFPPFKHHEKILPNKISGKTTYRYDKINKTNLTTKIAVGTCLINITIHPLPSQLHC